MLRELLFLFVCFKYCWKGREGKHKTFNLKSKILELSKLKWKIYNLGNHSKIRNTSTSPGEPLQTKLRSYLSVGHPKPRSSSLKVTEKNSKRKERKGKGMRMKKGRWKPHENTGSTQGARKGGVRKKERGRMQHKNDPLPIMATISTLVMWITCPHIFLQRPDKKPLH